MALMGIVVVPARDEERRITDCLLALAEQTVGREALRHDRRARCLP